jgi:hypothetical protein
MWLELLFEVPRSNLCSWTGYLSWNFRGCPRGIMSMCLSPTIVIVIIISGSTVLVRTSAASHGTFRNHIKAHGRTPLDEWSARCKGLYLHRTT